MRVWVVGAAGMLGSEVVAVLQAAGVEVVASDREVDITDERAVAAHLGVMDTPDWIVNCAAWTAVDAAETHAQAAFTLNAAAPGILAKAAASCGARLLHISTDYVFDGKASSPYAPDAPVDPGSVYGRSKLAGEVAIRKVLPQHVILRTAWLYGHNGPNFVSTMLRLMREREEIGVVADQYGAPTYTGDLAEAIGCILAHPQTHFGTWHYSNKGITTWYEFACAIYDIARSNGILAGECRIVPLTTEQYPTAAARPAYSVLDTGTLEHDWGISIPDWRDSLEKYIS